MQPFLFSLSLSHPWQLKESISEVHKRKTKQTHTSHVDSTTQLEMGASVYVQKRGLQNAAAPCPVGSCKCLPRYFEMTGGVQTELQGGVAKKHRREHLQVAIVEQYILARG